MLSTGTAKIINGYRMVRFETEGDFLIEIEKPLTAGPIESLVTITHKPSGEKLSQWGYYVWKTKQSIMEKLEQRIDARRKI